MTRVRDVRPTAPLDVIWEEASAKYIVEQATKVRDAAAKWGQNATAILAVAGLATAFKGRETLEGLTDASRGLVVVLVVVAIGLAGAALFFAAVATSGSTSWTWNDANSFRAAQTQAASDASGSLKASKWLVVAAFVVAVVAVIAIWTSPAKEAAQSQTLVIGRAGALVCGELTVEAGSLAISGSPLPAPPLSIHSVAECPGAGAAE